MSMSVNLGTDLNLGTKVSSVFTESVGTEDLDETVTP